MKEKQKKTDEELTPLQFKILETLYENGGSMEITEMIKKLEVREWMDCSWRRVGCEKPECKICGVIIEAQQRHLKKGEDPDSVKAVLEDDGKNFDEVLQMVSEDAEKLGIDLENLDEVADSEPEPEDSELYLKVKKWLDGVAGLIKKAFEDKELWVFTEEGLDLSWYQNILCAKIYRQYCNRLELDEGDEVAEFDYHYTKYVLIECLKITKNSLNELSRMDSPQKGALFIALAQLSELEEEILNI